MFDLTGTLEKYGVLAAVVFVGFVGMFGTGYYQGNKHGTAVCEAAQLGRERDAKAAVDKARADAKAAEDHAAQAKKDAEALIDKAWRETREEIIKLPMRDCGFTDDERLLLEHQINGDSTD